MREIWMVSHGNENTRHAIVGWWWALWLASTILGAFTSDIAEYSINCGAYIVSNGVDIALNIVLLILVSRIGAAYSRYITEPKEDINGRTNISGS